MSTLTLLSKPCEEVKDGDPINWRLCIFCQRGDKKEGPLVLKPRPGSYVTFLNAVRERATCYDGGYVEIQRTGPQCG